MKDKLTEIFPELEKEWIDRFFLDLTVHEDKSIKLQTLRGAIYNDSTDHEGGIQGNREKTLACLYPLLKEGKLVAGRMIGFDPEYQTAPTHIKDGNYLYEDIPGDADEIIGYIKRGWVTDSQAFEMFGCVFKLPDMDWPKIVT